MEKKEGKRSEKRKTTKKTTNTKKMNVDENKKGKKNKGKKKRKIFRKIILVLFILGIVAGLAGVGVIAGVFSSAKYQVSREELEINNFNSRVLDSEGNVVATLNGNENRKWRTMEEMPDYLPKMFIALEDERFYEHNGIDIKRTAGATLQFLLKRGSSSYGGSTITQQLIKLTFEDDDREGAAGVERKIREMARAMNTEKVLSKDEILERYLNKIFMGGTYYGVQTASEYYFSKDVKDLTMAEAAYLVAINDSPNAYKPFSEEEADKNKVKNRLKIVLTKFKEEAPKLGYELTDEAYNQAVAEIENGLAFNEGDVITTKASYSYHTAAAIDEAVKDFANEFNLTEQEARTRIENNGYTIYSTQDTSIQEIMQEEFVKDKYLIDGREKKEDGSLLNEGHTQAAMVIIDPSTGYVVGCMGGLGSDSNAVGYNRAVSGSKQPGSSIKPIGVVAPGLESGMITAATVYDDSSTRFGNYTPHNSDYSFHGLLTVRHAIEYSSNIVHVKEIAELGPENSAEFLRKMNFNMISQEDVGLTLALGATQVTPLQMAAAYAMIGNDGVYIEPTFYTKIVDKDGKTVLESKQEQKRMMTEANAYVLKEILTEPVTGNGGTATTCWISGMEVGAKTGSTNGYKDRWLCGITPYYAGACWYGFDKQERPNASGNNAATLWGNIMREVHSDLPNKNFDRPDGVITARICLDSGCIATDSCERTEVEYFSSDHVPGACQGHQKVRICTDTNKIANEYCKNVEENTYLVRPEKENTTLWSTDPGDKYDVPPTETCTTHTAPTKVKMIDVVGKVVATAKKAIEDLGLKVEIKYEEDLYKADGIVLKQSVKKDEQIEKGKTVTLTVNKVFIDDDNTINDNTINNNTNGSSGSTSN